MNKISVSSLKQFVLDVLAQCGVSPADAETTAEVLVTTDTWGVFTHGTKALRGYAKRLRAGGLNPTGRPAVEREGPAWALVNGDSSLAMVTGVFAMTTAIAKARASGIALVTVHNSCHFGAAGYYVHLAARENMIALAMANDVPSVAAPGSKGPVFGSNPFAFGAPGGAYPPVMLDISTAIVAGGKVWASLAEGRPIPGDWLVDSEGRPTTDGRLYPQRASLNPMAAHKGYGLALMIDVLSGVLSGSAVRDKVGSWTGDTPSIHTDHGHAFLVIDPAVVGPGIDFTGRMSSLIDGVKACPTIPASGPLKMPGEMEAGKAEQAAKEGIPLPDDVWESLRVAAGDASIPLPAVLS
jgi:LDH2 family malate/lactate/ureidoglycolate dehydrogenase